MRLASRLVQELGLGHLTHMSRCRRDLWLIFDFGKCLGIVQQAHDVFVRAALIKLHQGLCATEPIEVLKDLRAFAAHNGYDASAAALEGAEYQVSLEIEQRRKADGGFPELGDNFTVISRDL